MTLRRSRRRLAFAINATGPANLAAACAAAGARLVHISTDYVFAGDATAPYAEDAPMNPRAPTAAPRRRAGEKAVRDSGADALILRTAYLYGRGGACFPKTIAKAGRERGALSVVNDQIGQPTWTRDVAALIVRLLEADAPAGTYHATSAGQARLVRVRAGHRRCGRAGRHRVAPRTRAPTCAPAPPSRVVEVLGPDATAALGIEGIGPWRERWETAAPRYSRTSLG